MGQLAWRPRTEQASGLWDDGSGAAWWLFDSRGERQLLARPEDFGAVGVEEIAQVVWCDDGRRLLVVRDGSFSLFDARDRRLLELADGAVQMKGENPKLSSDGHRLAFVRDADLYVLDLQTGDERRLTSDGRPGVVVNGITDWVYWEEIWGRTTDGHWFNRDGTRLAYYHFDDSDVPAYPLVDTRPLHPQVESQRYPKAGDPLPRVEVRVVDLDRGETVRLDTGNRHDVYLARVRWHPDGEHLAVERLNRGQTRLELLLCHSAGGRCRVLTTQESPTWVNLANDFAFLADGRFLWSTQESGWRLLYLYSADGLERRRLTPEGWAVTGLEAFDGDAGAFVFTAHPTDPLGAAQRQVFRGRLDGDGAGVRRWTEEDGWHGVKISSKGHWIDEWSTAGTLPRQTLRHFGRPDWRHELPRRAPSYDVSRLPRWEHLTVPAADGTPLPAQIMKPAAFDASRRYPVVMYHYGCPGSQVVEDRWVPGRAALWHRMMAERGYVVLSLDNEGSPFFGKRGEDRLHRRFGERELAAQLAGVEYLSAQPWVDASRIGLWGWSGGGSNTLYCLLRRPGVWKAGVAGAPVTDWRYYDAIWIERYLDRPQDNEEGYTASAPLAYAADLKDELLLIHGTADDNVHPQNTLNLVQAFVEAGVHFELGLYPNARHSLQTFQKEGQRHFFERMTAFFDRHLAPE